MKRTHHVAKGVMGLIKINDKEKENSEQSLYLFTENKIYKTDTTKNSSVAFKSTYGAELNTEMSSKHMQQHNILCFFYGKR